jgi:hypothetical protein
MIMNCPQCKGSFENDLNCPDCGVRLVYRTESRVESGELATFAGSDAYRWQRIGAAEGASAASGAWSRFSLGLRISILLLATGLGYLLFHLFGHQLMDMIFGSLGMK